MGARLRPKFEATTEEPAELLLGRVSRELRARGCSVCGIATSDRIELHVPSERQHLWSPELRVTVERQGSETRLTGAYGPHPHVWTLYVGIYAGIAFAAFVVAVFGFAQWMMEREPAALYWLPALALLGIGAHAVAFVGQGLGADQMDELSAFLRRIVDQPVDADAPLHSGVRAKRPSDGSDLLTRTG
jgi:hypothetical protein